MARKVGGQLHSNLDVTVTSAGTGAVFGNPTFDGSGGITDLEVVERGTGYSLTDPLVFTHPTGINAVGTVTGIDSFGGIIEVTISTPGSGYNTPGIIDDFNIRLATIVYMDWYDTAENASRPLLVTTANQNIVVDGNTYMGIGSLGSIQSLEEGFDLQSYGITLTLSGIPKENIQEAFQDINFKTGYQNRRCTISNVFLDTDYNVIDKPIVIFQGLMDGANIEISDTITISIGVQSRLINWEIPKGGRFNSEDQKVWYPNDTGFDLIPSLMNKEIGWGKRVENGGGGGGVGFLVNNVYYNTVRTNRNARGAIIYEDPE